MSLTGGGNKWTDHVREFANKNGISYMCAMSNPLCSASYRGAKAPKAPRAKKLSKKEVKENISMTMEDRPAPARKENLGDIFESTTPIEGFNSPAIRDILKKKSVKRFKTIPEAREGILGISRPRSYTPPTPETIERERSGMTASDINVALPDVKGAKKAGRPRKYATSVEAKKAKITKTISRAKERADEKRTAKQQARVVKAKGLYANLLGNLKSWYGANTDTSDPEWFRKHPHALSTYDEYVEKILKKVKGVSKEDLTGSGMCGGMFNWVKKVFDKNPSLTPEQMRQAERFANELMADPTGVSFEGSVKVKPELRKQLAEEFYNTQLMGKEDRDVKGNAAEVFADEIRKQYDAQQKKGRGRPRSSSRRGIDPNKLVRKLARSRAEGSLLAKLSDDRNREHLEMTAEDKPAPAPRSRFARKKNEVAETRERVQMMQNDPKSPLYGKGKKAKGGRRPQQSVEELKLLPTVNRRQLAILQGQPNANVTADMVQLPNPYYQTGGATALQKGISAEMRSYVKPPIKHDLNQIIHSNDAPHTAYGATPNAYRDFTNQYDPNAEVAIMRAIDQLVRAGIIPSPQPPPPPPRVGNGVLGDYNRMVNHLVSHITDTREPIDPRDFTQAIQLIRGIKKLKGGYSHSISDSLLSDRINQYSAMKYNNPPPSRGYVGGLEPNPQLPAVPDIIHQAPPQFELPAFDDPFGELDVPPPPVVQPPPPAPAPPADDFGMGNIDWAAIGQALMNDSNA